MAADLYVNVDVTAIHAEIAEGDAEVLSLAGADATSKADAAQAAAIAAAATDATTKANAALAAALAASQPVDADLTAIAALVTQSFGRSLLTLASESATRSALGLWTTVMKAATETRNSTSTLAADSTLKLALAANTKYAIRFKVMVDTLATPDFKFRLSGPSSPTMVRTWMLLYGGPASGGTTTSYSASRMENTYSASDISIVSAADQLGTMISIDMIVRNGANAGDLEFQWAQNTSNIGSTSVLGGSYLEWRIIQ